MKIIADDKIPSLISLLGDAFDIELLPLNKINADTLQNADILICRSTLPVNQALLGNTPVKLVATATSGTDHIDKAYLSAKGIAVFSAPGSNAPAVADYILWMIAYLKKQGFTGKTAGVIGAGHVGTQVQRLLETLGFEVFMNDPPKTLREAHFSSTDLQEIAECDLICVHAELSHELPYSSYHLLSDAWFNMLKPDAVLINAARGAIINSHALLAHKKNIYLCLDVFENEPYISENILQKAQFITPHIAGYSVESFLRASEMVSRQIGNYFGIDEESGGDCQLSDVATRMKEASRPGMAVHEMAMQPSLLIDASECQFWHDVILKLYNFHSELDLTPETFYTLRERHRLRHDFSALSIKIGEQLPERDRCLLEKLLLKIQ